MSRLPNRLCVPLLVTLLGPVLAVAPTQAQSITAADTATTVQQTGNQYQIDGGRLSSDRTNLFHSFGQFGLFTGESAQFSNSTTVENIIGRVTGGDASIIDGLLAVDGNANLYLLNPAGIFLGENTQLNLGGSFSASTATGLSFGDELLDALGTNDYASLNGAPTAYEFASETGALINAGDLAVTSDQSLTLLGGQVINTGQLSGGEVLVMAVPGENRVRLSQTGSLLGLELETLPNAVPTTGFTVSTVPALLTGASDLGMATDITVNADGSVSLSGSSLQIPMDEGTAVVSGQLEADGGNIGVLGEQIALIGAAINASGDAGGGTVLIGGDELGNGTVPNAVATIIDENSVVRADARDIGNGGKIVAWGTNLLQSAGQLFARGGETSGDGGFVETSSLGQLEVSATPDVSAINGNGGLWLLDPANIRIVAGNATTNISNTNPFIVGNDPQDAELGVDQILAAFTGGANVEVRTTGTDPGDGNITLETELDFNNTGDNSLSLIADGDITLFGRVIDGDFSDDSLNLILNAGGSISANNSGIILGGDDSGNTGNLSLTSQGGDISLDFTNIEGFAQIDSNGSVTVDSSLSTGNRISVTSALGDVTIGSFVSTGAGIVNADVDITAANDISIGGGISTAGGDVTLIANSGSISIGGNTRSSSFFVTSPDRDTGDVTFRAPNGNVTFEAINASSFGLGGAGGNVIIEAAGDVQGTGGIIFSEENTIRTDGETTNGDVDITHGGGDFTPFTVGDSSVNGTAGAISTGEVTIDNESFTGNAERGNVRFSTTTDFGSPGGFITCPGCFTGPSFPITPTTGTTTGGSSTGNTSTGGSSTGSTSTMGATTGGSSTETGNIQTEESPETAEPETTEEFDNSCFPECEDEETSESVGQVQVGTINVLPAPELALQNFERQLTEEVSDHLGIEDSASTQAINADVGALPDLPSAQNSLNRVQSQIGKRPALIYAMFGDGSTAEDAGKILQNNSPSDKLELMLVTGDDEPRYIQIDATRKEILSLANRFRRQVTSPHRVGTTSYLPLAQELYQLLIAPLEAELEAQGIDTISFITDAGLRSLPLAALHDGENFLIEKYNVGLMPSLSLTDLTYRDIRNVGALVAGTSVFADQVHLPSVPVELNAISSQWSSALLQGDTFNLDTLKGERQKSSYGIIHLATHGEFNAGDLSRSYLHLHNEKIGLDQLRNLGLHKPGVELITLSACQTALGSRTAELGFAGFAVLAGAKTAVASLWSVSDEASAGLMIEFYERLQGSQPTIKANALRQAQLAMLRGEITVEGDQLKLPNGSHPLPLDLAKVDGEIEDFSHPYYWAAFSLIGSPW